MEVLICKSNPVYGIKSLEIFQPFPDTPKSYLLVIDGELFSFRVVANLVFIAGEDIAHFNIEMIAIIRRLIRKAHNRRRDK